MAEKDINCNHACKNSCASLNEALKKETASVQYYESVYDECNSPDVREFLGQIIEDRRSDILKIIQKLNEIHAKSQIVDGVINSFEEERTPGKSSKKKTAGR